VHLLLRTRCPPAPRRSPVRFGGRPQV